MEDILNKLQLQVDLSEEQMSKLVYGSDDWIYNEGFRDGLLEARLILSNQYNSHD